VATSGDDPWTIGRVLGWTTQHFAEKGIDSPRLDAELLLASVLQKNRLYLYTHYDQPLNESERAGYRALVQRRSKREPVAYILGEREFYGLPFTVTRDVLVPRPETEHLVDAVREWLDAHVREKPRLCDVGTGSGAIAIALAVQAPAAEVVAIDVSEAALAIARANATRHGVADRVRFVAGDLLAPVKGEPPFDVIVANLPYVPSPERPQLMPEVRDHEPGLALFGGEDGLDLVRRLIALVPERLAPEGLVALEIGAGQWPKVRDLLEANEAFTHVRSVADLAGHARVALAERVG
jgi:release factor glutamine methyltransferase